ncbi:MAG: hypothetical protein DSM106950_11720 [Stigonema ocellatum SAG 48.90 = DSM 106950]|nr:hypothetical protein [Stigonema ocellatum SAG 48.90 = DSM 106950]
MKGKYLTLMGTALILVLSSKAVDAQAAKFRVQQINDASGGPAVTPSTGEPISQAPSTSTSESKPRKLRPDVLKILCQDFPLNSQCQGSSATKPDSSSGSTSETGKKPKPEKLPNTTTPGTAPSDTGTPGSRRGLPPDSAPLSNPPGGPGTPDNTNPSGTSNPPSDSGTPGSSTQEKVPTTTTPGTAPSDTGTPGSRRGLPPDSAPLSPPSGTGTPDNTTPSGGTNPGDSSAPGSITQPGSVPAPRTAP